MKNRIEIFRENLKMLGADAAIITDEVNIRYLCDFAFSDGFVFITLSSAHLVTDFRYYEMALSNASKDFAVVMPDNRKEYVRTILSDECIRTLAFEGDKTSYSQYNKYLSDYPGIDLVDLGDVLYSMRQMKSSDEIEKMARAQSITDAAFSHILTVLNPNMTEIEVAAELEYFMKKMGADGLAFDTIAVSGDASALPHGTPRNVKLKPGFLTMDFGAKLGGYCSDMTRTVIIGRADADIKKLYNTVLTAQLAALDYLEEGRDCFLADKCARDIIDEEYKGAFGHLLGHSIGLECHEMPALSPRASGKILVPSNVVTVEPGIYLLGKYGCRIEDMVAINEKGIYNFTHSTKDLIEIY